VHIHMTSVPYNVYSYSLSVAPKYAYVAILWKPLLSGREIEMRKGIIRE